jgi:hypothetical protein
VATNRSWRIRIAFGALLAGALLASVADARVLVLGGSAARPDGPDAGGFTVRVVRLIAANRYAEAWTLLYPAHRVIVGQSAYSSCESLSPIPGRLQSVQVLSVRNERVPVPGEDEPMPGASVKVRIVIVGVGRVVVTPTFHAVRADGHWTWILPTSRYRLYLHGRCPDAPPSYRGPDSSGPAI